MPDPSQPMPSPLAHPAPLPMAGSKEDLELRLGHALAERDHYHMQLLRLKIIGDSLLKMMKVVREHLSEPNQEQVDQIVNDWDASFGILPTALASPAPVLNLSANSAILPSTSSTASAPSASSNPPTNPATGAGPYSFCAAVPLIPHYGFAADPVHEDCLIDFRKAS